MTTVRRGRTFGTALLCCVVICAHAQTKVPGCLVRSIEEHARIIAGTIKEVRPGSADAPLGSYRSAASATISINRYLRGPEIPAESINLLVDWTDGPSKPWNFHKPFWYDVNVKPGEKLLLGLLSADEMGEPRGGPYEFRAICVVEYDAYSSAIPIFERMVRLESAEGSAKIARMKQALSDPTPAIRAIAINYLTSVRVRDPHVRRFVFQHFAPIALQTKNPERRDALYAITQAYDPFAGGTELNYQILSFISERMVDPDPLVRSDALQCIYNHLFGGGTDQPDPVKIHLSNRKLVVQQLRSDSYTDLYRHGLDKQALKLAEAFAAP